MRGPRAGARAGCRALAVILCVAGTVLVGPGAPAQRLAPALLPAAVPTATPPRIAFTDARDEQDYAVDPGDRVGALAPPPVTHSGETSVNGSGVSASVSTLDEPHGEVYITGPSDPDGSPTSRLTCDSAVESHPVVSPDGTRVAYASNASGTFRLWLGAVPGTDLDPEPLPGSVPSCEGLPLKELAGAPGGENLWPSWVGDDRLVFSGTGLDPLGDIWIVDVGSADVPVYDATATRLTDDPAAETQPSHGVVPRTDDSYGTLSVVVLTTTRFRPDGSLGYLVLPQADPSAGPTPTGAPVIFSVGSLWGDKEPDQGTEAVWSPDGTEVAYTTTEWDPYGDVIRAGVIIANPESVELGANSDPTIAAEPGRAESHPAWLPQTKGPQEWRYTVRTASGDVSDVVASDGTGRRTIAGDVVDGVPLDESTPTYSPDGSRIAYSRTASGSGGREIVMADSGGGNVVVLDTGRGTDDTDVEPAWSPDGTRIAFVRFPGCECSFRPSEIWVADVVGRTAKQVTTAPKDTAYWDENPSWSPDGTRLVIARAVELAPDLVVSLTGPETVERGQTVQFAARVENSGRGTANGVTLKIVGPTGVNDSGPAVVLDPEGDICKRGVDNSIECSLEDLVAGGTTSVPFRVSGREVATPTISAEVAQTGVPGETVLANNTATRSVMVTLPPDVEVTVEPTSFADLGYLTPTETITFTLTNTGSLPVTSGTLTVDSAGVGSDPGEVSLAGAETGSTCVEDGVASLSCELGTIEGGESSHVAVVVSPVCARSVEVTGTVTQVPGEVDKHDNAATVTGSVDGGYCSSEGIASAVPRALLTEPVATEAAALSASVSRPTVVREVPLVPADGHDTTLWVIDASTGAGHALRRRAEPEPEDLPGRGPAWSPDGLRVAYENHGSVLVLHLADPHGDAVALRPGTDHPLIDVVTGFTAWSDTGATPAPSRPQISVAEDPAWSPDGKELAISAQPAGQPDQRGIYRIAPDGTGLAVVAQGRGPETEPAWQPFADLDVTLAADPAVVLIGARSTLTATVRNLGPARTPQVVLELTIPSGLSVASLPAPCTPSAPQLVSCDLGTLAPGDAPVVKVPVTGMVVGTHSVRADVGSHVPDSIAANNTATAAVEVTLVPPTTDVAVTVRMDPDPGFVGGTGTLRVEVSNSAPGEATEVQVTISHPDTIVTLVGTPPCFTGSACPIGSLAPGGRRTLTAPIRFVAAGTGVLAASVTSTIDDTSAGNDRATRTVTVKQPVVRILQPIGTPGSIAMVVGEDFPPGSQVLLAWDHGLNQREIRATVDRDGTVPPTQVLLFRRDQIGTRLLLATPQDPTQYTAVSTPMLVTPRTVTPPADFVSRN